MRFIRWLFGCPCRSPQVVSDGIGNLHIAPNRKMRTNEAKVYGCVPVRHPSGKIIPLLITDTEWKRQKKRAEDQPEDVPAKWGGKA